MTVRYKHEMATPADIPGLNAALAAKQDNLTGIADVPGLEDALDLKANATGRIGTPGAAGFGVGVCPDCDIPSGFIPLAGHTDPASDNYGNYQFRDGSVMVFVPKFYYRINNSSNPTHNTYGPNDIDIVGTETYASEAEANTDEYVLHRAFKDGGNIKSGFFVDKYMCSKNVSGTGYVASSIKNGLPISTHADHNPIAGLTAITSNNYAACVDAPHARDGVDGAINSDSIFFCNTRFIQSALAMLSLAHSQAATSTTNCAWYDATHNYPKGCNNNALRDCDDSSVLYVSDGYSNCGKTGSGTVFGKTTHNGQNCGVADLNGLMYEVNLGLTRPGSSSTDTTNQNDTSAFYVLKETTATKTLTGGWNTAGDAWGDATHLSSLYDSITLSHISSTALDSKFGNGENQVLSHSVSGDGYSMTGLGIPKDSSGKSSGGTNLFGKDRFYEYHRANLCVLSCYDWSSNSHAGAFACNLYPDRSSSSISVGFRAACYPE